MRSEDISPFESGSFYDNFEAGVKALGAKRIPLAFDLAKVQFRSIEDRDNLLNFLANEGGDMP